LSEDAEAAVALTDLARRVDALRQRSAELRGVMSSTRDLLAIPDADLILQRIVDRAQELMKVDVTYLSVYEPLRDELYVRAATGTISPRFFGMVVPAGIGVASLAVRTQHPQTAARRLRTRRTPTDSDLAGTAAARPPEPHE